MFSKYFPIAKKINTRDDADLDRMSSVCERVISRSVVHILNDNFFNMTPAGKYRVILDIEFEEPSASEPLTFTRSLHVPVTSKENLTKYRDRAGSRLSLNAEDVSVRTSFCELRKDLRAARNSFPRIIHMQNELTIMKLFIYDALLENNDWTKAPNECIGDGIRLVHVCIPKNAVNPSNKWKIYSLTEVDMAIIHDHRLSKKIEAIRAARRS